MITLGTYKFEGVNLPQSWSTTRETQYAQIPIINGKPVLQNTGESLKEIEIGILLSLDFCKPRTELDKLELSRINGEVLQCIDDTGYNLGRYVIRTIKDVNEQLLINGYPSLISLSITLLEFNGQVSDAPGESLNISQVPLSQTSVGLSINEDLNEGMKPIEVPTSPTMGMYKKISKLAQSAQDSFERANEKIENTKKIIYRAKDVVDRIQDCKEALETVKNAADINNLDDLLAANTKLESANYQLKGASAPLAAFIACREGGE